MVSSSFRLCQVGDLYEIIQPQKIRATVWYPSFPGSSFAQNTISMELAAKNTKVDWDCFTEIK